MPKDCGMTFLSGSSLASIADSYRFLWSLSTFA